MSLSNITDNTEIAIVKSKAAYFMAVSQYSKDTSLLFLSDNIGINDENGYPLLIFFTNDIKNKTFYTNEVSLSELFLL